jgi:hypothetical protein
MSPGVYELVNGICALIASLLIWKITGNYLGWLVLFVPGSAFVLTGLWKSWKDR